MANKAKPIAEALAQNPTLPIAAPPSSILQSAIDRQEKELTDLQTELDRRSDEFADRAAAIVRNSLETAYQKAQTRIMTVEVPRFLDLEGNTLPLLSPQNLTALPVVEVTEC